MRVHRPSSEDENNQFAAEKHPWHHVNMAR